MDSGVPARARRGLFLLSALLRGRDRRLLLAGRQRDAADYFLGRRGYVPLGTGVTVLVGILSSAVRRSGGQAVKA
jgi:hypothetical protein